MSQILEDRLSADVRTAPGVHLIPRHQELLAKLNRFEAPYLEERLLKSGTFKSPEEYREAFVEFKKYVGLVGVHKNEPLAMASEKVDEVWHQFILFTRKYHNFCKDTLGEYLHHLPRTSHTPLHPDGDKNVARRYREMYGEPSKLWNFAGKNDCDGDSGSSPSGFCSKSSNSSDSDDD